jgi:hypothetical protein
MSKKFTIRRKPPVRGGVVRLKRGGKFKGTPSLNRRVYQ